MASFCTNCGAENADGTKFCVSCGNAMASSAAQPAPAASTARGAVAYAAPAAPVYTAPQVQYASPGGAPAAPTGPTGPIMSVGQFMITFLLLCIPILNLVLMFMWAFGSKPDLNPNKKNMARAMLLWFAIWIALSVLFTILFGETLATLS
ncbi:MAG: zinc ribbon domain-containing protein [Syntrophomonadaceae bacterium]|nr:zinc ribbon domain-containing protein [Syntrophomonadaceae bacterium]